MKDSKSVLDGVPVDDQAFPLNKGLAKKREPLMAIVGHCPACGSPVYGPAMVTATQEILTRYSCECLPRSKRGLDIQAK